MKCKIMKKMKTMMQAATERKKKWKRKDHSIIATTIT